ncbi:MAG TPA: 50S ribosomal protein L10 [Candidatus Saccharimonadales bacterium]|nr:50S ribosomal protein L10 [Candidatus Saccharimonadales bacterium]
MALTKDRKSDVVKEVSELLSNSKMTVIAKYQGTGVKELQLLRRNAKVNGTKVKVIKNRLVIQAINNQDNLKDINTDLFKGMLIYAFNSDDEVAPAQSLHIFAKQYPTLEFVGAITAEGKFLEVDSVKALAVLPGKDQLIAGLIMQLVQPVHGLLRGLGGNLHGILSGLEAKAVK